MLKNFDNRLNAEVIACLRDMGHGDTLVLADANFPAAALARETTLGRVLTMENLSLGAAAEAVLSVLPLDTFVADHAVRMEVVEAPDEIPAVQREVQAAIDRAEGRARPMLSLERFAFYEAAKRAYAVIRTGERRFYGNVILRKGVIGQGEG